MRNIGNIVPGYGEMMGGVSAVIEYAVSALKVKHVVICGHSDCGAMKALEHPRVPRCPAHRQELAAKRPRRRGGRPRRGAGR